MLDQHLPSRYSVAHVTSRVAESRWQGFGGKAMAKPARKAGKETDEESQPGKPASGSICISSVIRSNSQAVDLSDQENRFWLTATRY